MKWIECPGVDCALESSPAARIAAFPDSLVERARTLLAGVTLQIPNYLRPLADAIRIRTRNRFHAEVTGNASRIGVSWRDLMLANISYDLMLARIGCSTVALATSSGPVLARNMDWWPEDLLAQASARIRWTRGGELAFAAAGWPGAIGIVSGLSARGFGLVLNAVSGKEGPNPTGYPMLLFLRNVIEEARDFGDALQRLRSTKLASSGLITLVGTRNEERVVIERSPRRAVLRHPDVDAPLVTTNHYRAFECSSSNELGGLAGSSCTRFEVLSAATSDIRGRREIPDDELLYWLSDQNVIQSITAQHVIIRPASATIRVFVPSRLLTTDN